MFERQIMAHLREWKNKSNRKPLVLRGARQVGKTTIINAFGKEFDNYLYFNLDVDADRALFERNIPLDDLIDSLFARQGVRKKDGSTLLFIDEIQSSPQTISLLRYFKEKRSDIHVISAGSLLENVVDVKVSFPVGRVEYMALRPCSFYEFLTALGKDNLRYFIDYPEQSTAVHNQLMSLFNQYTIVGGMPEVVQEYADTHDVLALDNIYESLVQGYKDDVEKYVNGGKLAEVVRFLISTSWTKAGQIVTLGGFADSDYRAREVGEAFRLLQKAMLLELVYPTTSVGVPALSEEKRQPKVIMLDTGLTNYQAGVRKELIGANDILDVWRGHLAEQVVAQELLTLNDKVSQRRQFWVKGNGSAEVDFVLTFDSHLFPIEVKSGRNSHLRSMHSFIDQSSVDIGIRIWSGPYSVDEIQTTIGKKSFRLVNIPFYMVGNIEKILSDLV
jgi:predicted AAA+ superfamily ATPase